MIRAARAKSASRPACPPICPTSRKPWHGTPDTRSARHHRSAMGGSELFLHHARRRGGRRAARYPQLGAARGRSSRNGGRESPPGARRGAGRAPCGCARYTATRWSTPTPARRMNPPPMPASRPRPGACWPSWLPIACPWSSPTRTAPCWARRTPAGAALPAACWKTPCAPCRPRCRTRAAGAPGSGPASGRRHSRWGPMCCKPLRPTAPGRGPVRAAPGPAGQMAGRPARTGAAALAARWRTGAILRFVHGAGLAIFRIGEIGKPAGWLCWPGSTPGNATSVCLPDGS